MKVPRASVTASLISSTSSERRPLSFPVSLGNIQKPGGQIRTVGRDTDGFDAHLCQIVRLHGGLEGVCAVLVQEPLARVEEFRPFAAKSLSQLPQNLHESFLVDNLAV